jgi:DNA-directed RNA polymerase subunit RPC12/RpoP
MELTVQQPCPTCGAEILLHEDDRLVQCEYCDVHNYMIHRKLPRFLLPARLPSHVSEERLFYVPYLRFKGIIFYCQKNKVFNKIIDTTRVGLTLKSLPVSLGLRPQAMNVKQVTGEILGHFVRQTIKARTIFTDAAKVSTLFAKDKKNPILHRAFIGETVSRVYLPLYVYHGILYDGVNHSKLGPSSLIDSFAATSVPASHAWEPSFLSTICPGCGATMKGSRDSLVMTCTNCETLWQEKDGEFIKVNFGVIESANKECVYLPFWHIEPEVAGCRLATLADFLELTNQPVVVRNKHRDQKLAFIVPAFKVNPNTFLNSAKNLTSVQLAFANIRQQPVADSYPVTLPQKEAVQALKVILAGAAVSPKKVFEVLEKLAFRVTAQKLLYLPFHWVGHDVRQEQTGFSFSSASLRFGRSM